MVMSPLVGAKSVAVETAAVALEALLDTGLLTN